MTGPDLHPAGEIDGAAADPARLLGVDQPDRLAGLHHEVAQRALPGVAGPVQLLRVAPFGDRHQEPAALRQHQRDQVGVSQGPRRSWRSAAAALVTGEHSAGDVGRLRQPFLPVLGLGEEPGVLDRDACGGGERRDHLARPGP